jgi:hypothetical protein
MKRREFLVVLGSAIVSPIATRAQSPAGPVIGFINSTTPEGFARPLIGFGRGLGEEGFVEGRNVRIEYRWARGEYQRLPGLVADLIREHVNVIATTGPRWPPWRPRTSARPSRSSLSLDAIPLKSASSQSPGRQHHRHQYVDGSARTEAH